MVSGSYSIWLMWEGAGAGKGIRVKESVCEMAGGGRWSNAGGTLTV